MPSWLLLCFWQFSVFLTILYQISWKLSHVWNHFFVLVYCLVGCDFQWLREGGGGQLHVDVHRNPTWKSAPEAPIWIVLVAGWPGAHFAYRAQWVRGGHFMYHCLMRICVTSAWMRTLISIHWKGIQEFAKNYFFTFWIVWGRLRTLLNCVAKCRKLWKVKTLQGWAEGFGFSQMFKGLTSWSCVKQNWSKWAPGQQPLESAQNSTAGADFQLHFQWTPKSRYRQFWQDPLGHPDLMKNVLPARKLPKLSQMGPLVQIFR